MKTLKIHIKITVLFFSVLILLQGCTVYKSKNVPLEEAYLYKDRVKLETKNNESLKYLKITKMNQEYFGVKKVRGDLINVPLQKEEIESIKIKDQTLSATLSILSFLGWLFVVAVVGVAIGGGIGISL
jgi:hypothetical protein